MQGWGGGGRNLCCHHQGSRYLTSSYVTWGRQGVADFENLEIEKKYVGAASWPAHGACRESMENCYPSPYCHPQAPGTVIGSAKSRKTAAPSTPQPTGPAGQTTRPDSTARRPEWAPGFAQAQFFRRPHSCPMPRRKIAPWHRPPAQSVAAKMPRASACSIANSRSKWK